MVPATPAYLLQIMDWFPTHQRVLNGACSLFVHVANTKAGRLYERPGFAIVQYPQAAFAIPDSHYMVAS
jgi:hypothetical protein